MISNTVMESIPSGVIVAWSGSSTNIPAGWALCDGNNNTPDLSGRFILGYGRGYQVGNKAGQESVTLNANTLPSHTHIV